MKDAKWPVDPASNICIRLSRRKPSAASLGAASAERARDECTSERHRLADNPDIMADLWTLCSLKLVELTQTVADLESSKKKRSASDLRKMRALQAELLGTADALNRSRRKTSSPRGLAESGLPLSKAGSTPQLSALARSRPPVEENGRARIRRSMPGGQSDRTDRTKLSSSTGFSTTASNRRCSILRTSADAALTITTVRSKSRVCPHDRESNRSRSSGASI